MISSRAIASISAFRSRSIDSIALVLQFPRRIHFWRKAKQYAKVAEIRILSDNYEILEARILADLFIIGSVNSEVVNVI